MRGWIIILFLCLWMVGCRSSQSVTSSPSAPTTRQTPEWVRQYPVLSGYYVGIGIADRFTAGFREMAQKAALNDIAAQIKVQVSSNSFYMTVEQDLKIREWSQAQIRLQTSEELEGFELVDNFLDDRYYYVYYRLSKAEFARLKDAQKQTALRQSMAFLHEGRRYRQQHELSSALLFLARATASIAPHFHESLIIQGDLGTTDLATALPKEIFETIKSIQLQLSQPLPAVYHGWGSAQEIFIQSRIRLSDGTSVPAAQLPFKVEWVEGRGAIQPAQLTSDASGNIRFRLVNMNGSQPNQSLQIHLDTDQILSSITLPTSVRQLFDVIGKNLLQIAYQPRPIRLRLEAKEENQGKPMSSGPLSDWIKNQWAGRGFVWVNDDASPDLWVRIQAKTQNGGVQFDMTTVLMDYELSVWKRQGKELVYRKTGQGFKGVHIDPANAGIRAYREAERDFLRTIEEARQTIIQHPAFPQ